MQVPRTWIEEALVEINKKYNNKLVPGDTSLRDWLRQESHGLKQCLIIVRTTEFRSRDFSRLSFVYFVFCYVHLFSFACQAQPNYETTLRSQEDLERTKSKRSQFYIWYIKAYSKYRRFLGYICIFITASR